MSHEKKILTGEGLYMNWMPPGTGIWSNLTPDEKGRWQKLALICDSPYLVPRKMVYTAVANFVANTLGVNKTEIMSGVIEPRITTALRDWIHNYVNQKWLQKLIAETLRAELAHMIKGRFQLGVKHEVTIIDTQAESK